MSQPGETNVKDLGLSVVKTDDVEENTVDVALCIDLTGSMRNEATAARNKLLTVFNAVKTKYPTKKFRLALVGYRDKNDKKQFDIVDFTEDIESIKTVLNNIIENDEVMGGGDIPEDIAGAQHHLHELSWGDQSIKQVIHIADAPPHGLEYHDDTIADDLPDGDEEYDCKALMTLFAAKQVGYMFVKMNATTDKMNTVFRLAYQQGRVPGAKANYILSDMSVQFQQSRETYERKMMVRNREERERSHTFHFHEGAEHEFDIENSVTRGGFGSFGSFGYYGGVDRGGDRGGLGHFSGYPIVDHDRGGDDEEVEEIKSSMETSPSDDIIESQIMEGICSQL